MLQSSVTRLQKIDMMLSLMPLHSKRLHCILDVSQTSLRLLCSFSMVCKFRFIGSPIPLATDQCFRL